MTLSKRSLATLLDLVEIKLSCVEVWDQEDAREKSSLEHARSELTALLQMATAMQSATKRDPRPAPVRVPGTTGIAYSPQIHRTH